MEYSKLCIRENFIAPGSCEKIMQAFENIAELNGTKKIQAVRTMPSRTEVAARCYREAGERDAHDLLTDLRRKIESEISAYFNASAIFPEYTLLTKSSTGDQHTLHADAEKHDRGAWIPNHTPQRSHTGMLYLNTGGGKDYSGGEIEFPNFGIKIAPKAGLLVGFKTDHEYIHQVPPILSGHRFALSLWFTENKANMEFWQAGSKYKNSFVEK